MLAVKCTERRQFSCDVREALEVKPNPRVKEIPNIENW